MTDAVTKLANVPSVGQDPHTPPPSPSYLTRRDSTEAAFYPLTNSGSTDSAVEATEEVLETLEGRTKAGDEESEEVIEPLTSKTNDDEEKENICEVDPNVEMEPICDKECELEKRSDLSSNNPAAPLLIDEVADRRNLAEIKIK